MEIYQKYYICHVHLVTREGNLSNASDGYSKKDRVRKPEGQDVQDCDKKNAIVDRTSAIHKDSPGVFPCGQLIDIRGVGLAFVSVVTVGRNRERAMRIASVVAQQLHVPEDDIFVENV